MAQATRHIDWAAGAVTAKEFVKTRPDWLLERFAKMPMTNFLYVVGGYLWVRTCEHYMRSPTWQPSPEWLIGLSAFTGGAITQWVKKRTTDHEYQRIQQQGRNSAALPDANGAERGRDVRNPDDTNGGS